MHVGTQRFRLILNSDAALTNELMSFVNSKSQLMGYLISLQKKTSSTEKSVES